MDIFESLENLNVSEECFDEIISIVEKVLAKDLVQAAKISYPQRDKEASKIYNDPNATTEEKNRAMRRKHKALVFKNLPSPKNSSVSAKALVQAAKNSQPERLEKYKEADNKRKEMVAFLKDKGENAVKYKDLDLEGMAKINKERDRALNRSNKASSIIYPKGTN